MKAGTARECAALKRCEPDLVLYFMAALTEEDRLNRRRQGEDAAEGRGRAQILAEILEQIDGAMVPPIC